MWTRKELKLKGKAAFLANYWKTVLVSLIIVFIIGGANGRGLTAQYRFGSNDGTEAVETEQGVTYHGPQDAVSDPQVKEAMNKVFNENTVIGRAAASIGGTIALVIIFLTILTVLAGMAICVSVFLINPLEVGTARFMLRNLNVKAELKELVYCFDHGYLKAVKTMFFKELYTILWAMLLIIPGIIKVYEYRMMPYIIAENPEMPTSEVFAKSRAMMKGQKWDAFILDLSFIGWEILSLFTGGILSVFYVNPYRHMTNAALYERLAYTDAGTISEL